MDIFIGVLINAALIILGAGAGVMLSKVKKVKSIGERVFQAFAIFVMIMGIQGMDISQPMYYLICLIIGIAIGEIIDIDKQFNRVGAWAEKKFAKNNGETNFAEGFVTASLLFCIGSMAFLGALESGIQHEHTIYTTKGTLDCISAVTLAMGSGISVAFSAVSILVYQGILVLCASLLAPVLTDETVAMCVSVGSLDLVFIGLNMLGITKIKVANMLPAMFIPMIWQAIQLIIAK